MNKGKVYLVGAGPGRPDLITVRGLSILKEADVIIYDYLVDKRLLEDTKEGAELICCDRLGPSTSLRANVEPLDFARDGSRSGELVEPRSRTIGKRRYSDGFLTRSTTPSTVGSLSVNPERTGASYSDESNGLKDQDEINDLMVKKVKEGKKVIRLKNGDPSIFSRCSQELNALVKEKIEFEVVPGVTAASAASCLSGIPLTDRRFASSCIFVTGNEDPTKKRSLINWDAIAKGGTVVLYMAVENLANVVKQMLKAGKDKNTNVAIIKDVSLPTQKVLTGTLRNITAKAKIDKLRPPAIIIIGKVAKMEEEFNWLRKNKRILFTGLSRERFFTKGTYFHLPMIEIKPLEDYTEFDNWIKKIAKNGNHKLSAINYKPFFDWIVFSSRYGVEHFFKRLKSTGCDLRTLIGVKIAAIGNSTENKLLDFGILADLVPKKESSEGLIEEFKKIDIKGKKIFLPRSDISDKGLSKKLNELEAKVITSFAYRNVAPCDLPDLNLNFFNEIIFTSPSTVRNFKRKYKKVPKNVKISSIGEVTKKEVKKQFMVNS